MSARLGHRLLARAARIGAATARERTAAILGAALLLAASVAWAQESHLEKGLELFRQERYQDALGEFEQAHRAQPANAAIENVLGITTTRLGRIAEANRHYEAAIRLNPKLAAAHKNLGFNYLNAKQYEPAERQLKAALALDPEDPFPHYYLALVFLSTSREQDAVGQLGPSLPLFANDAEAAVRMVNACLHTGHDGEAAALVKELDEKSVLTPAGQYSLALAFHANRQYAEAVERFRRILAAEPSSWSARYNLALALLTAKQGGEAVTLLEALASERPQDANVLSALGAAYEFAEKPAQALEAYKKAVHADPQNPDRYLDYTRLLMDLDRYDESAEFVENGLKVVQDSYALTLRLGSVQMMSGQYAQARETFRKAIDAQPGVVLGYVALAQACFRERMDDEAARVLAEARAKLPQDFLLEYFYGLALARMERRAEAVPALENATRLKPAVPEPHYELGKLYFGLNRVAEARAEFERVIALAPRHANAYYQLSRVYARLGDTSKAHEMAEETRKLKEAQRMETMEMQRSRLSAFHSAQSK